MITESESASLTYSSLEKEIGFRKAQVNWLNISGEIVFSINYMTDLNPNKQKEEFSRQFYRIAGIGSYYFSRTNTTAKTMMIMAEDINNPTTKQNPPLYEVIFDKQHIIEWMNHEIDEDAFYATWFIVPLPNK